MMPRREDESTSAIWWEKAAAYLAAATMLRVPGGVVVSSCLPPRVSRIPTTGCDERFVNMWNEYVSLLAGWLTSLLARIYPVFACIFLRISQDYISRAESREFWYRCPVCRKSMEDMREYFSQMVRDGAGWCVNFERYFCLMLVFGGQGAFGSSRNDLFGL